MHSFWQKKIDRVRLRYGLIMPYVEQPPIDFSVKSCFGDLTCSHWLEWVHYAWLRSEYDNRWSLALCVSLNPSEVIRGHWPWLTRCLPRVAKLVVLGGFLRSWDRKCDSFFMQPCLYGLLTFSDVDENHWPSLPSGGYSLWWWCCLLPGRYTSQLFDQDTIKSNGMLFYSEFDGKHAGEYFISLV